MREKIKELRAQFEQWLRGHCSRMTPERRLIMVLIIGALFTVTNIYITAKAIYEIGHEDARNESMQINHIAPLIIPAPNASLTESENNLIPKNNDND